MTSPTEDEELLTERMHLMTKRSTKALVNVVARGDSRFKSDADVVRYLLDTYLPDMAAVVGRAGTPELRDAEVADEPIGPRKFSGRMPTISRDQLERSRPRFTDELRAAQLEAARQADVAKEQSDIDQAAAADAPKTPRTPCPGLHSVVQAMGKTRCSSSASVHIAGRWISEGEQWDNPYVFAPAAPTPFVQMSDIATHRAFPPEMP